MKLRKILAISTSTVKIVDLDNKDNDFVQYWNDQNCTNYFRDENAYKKYKRISNCTVNEISLDKNGNIVVFVKQC